MKFRIRMSDGDTFVYEKNVSNTQDYPEREVVLEFMRKKLLYVSEYPLPYAREPNYCYINTAQVVSIKPL